MALPARIAGYGPAATPVPCRARGAIMAVTAAGTLLLTAPAEQTPGR
jgi:hypothetical protein